MTRKEVIEGNKLIAEFITIGVNTETGWLHFRHPEIEAAPPDYEYYRFEESWDWLMPVCIKLGMKFISTDIVLTYKNVINEIRNLEKN